MAESDVIPLPPRQLPATILIPTDVTEGLTPREMRELKDASGQRLDYLLGPDADWDEKTQVGVWIALKRAGYDPTWDDTLDVRPVQEQAPPDPTSAGS